jgi:hypothetical protein
MRFVWGEVSYYTRRPATVTARELGVSGPWTSSLLGCLRTFDRQGMLLSSTIWVGAGAHPCGL